MKAGPGASVGQQAADLGSTQGSGPQSQAEVSGAGTLGAAAARLGLPTGPGSAAADAPEPGGTSASQSLSSIWQRCMLTRTFAAGSTGGDLREPLTSAKRELVQASAAPAISDLHAEEGANEEAAAQQLGTATDEREPLSSVKREVTQASAAPAIAHIHVSDPESGAAAEAPAIAVASRPQLLSPGPCTTASQFVIATSICRTPKVPNYSPGAQWLGLPQELSLW